MTGRRLLPAMRNGTMLPLVVAPPPSEASMDEVFCKSRLLGPGIVFALLVAGCGGGDPYRRLTPLERQLYLEPTPISTTLSFDRIAQGADSGCLLTPTGQAWCWGNNEHGQLGAATALSCQGGLIACSWEPVAAQAPARFTEISLSRLHGCGIDTAGQAWCWGFGVGGQLGNGANADSATPVAIAGSHRFVHVDAGNDGLLSCALDDAGAAWCWGPGDSGGMGNGTTDGSNVPVQVLAPQAFVSAGAGANHGCGLDATGQAWCWGRNPYGVLGRGVSGASLVPAAVTGGHPFAALVVGGNFNCGLTPAGAAWCWGFALSLGDGVQAHSDVPVAVAGGHVFASISAGYQHACGLTSDGTAWCWGVAALTGGGTEEESKVPVAVAGGHHFRLLRAGGTATCAITLAGSLLCWGLNSNGAVGQNNLGP
jgi:alpha-tubulin suppressor-like RCC1 family protein